MDCMDIGEVTQASDKMKTGKALGPLNVSLELYAASLEIGTQVIALLCQTVIIIIIMVIFKCYFSGELIALS